MLARVQSPLQSAMFHGDVSQRRFTTTWVKTIRPCIFKAARIRRSSLPVCIFRTPARSFVVGAPRYSNALPNFHFLLRGKTIKRATKRVTSLYIAPAENHRSLLLDFSARTSRSVHAAVMHVSKCTASARARRDVAVGSRKEGLPRRDRRFKSCLIAGRL